MRARHLFLALVPLLCPSPCSPCSSMTTAAQEAAPTGTPAEEQIEFRVAVDAVYLNAVVTAGRRLISGLKAEDFEIRENGVQQKLSFFASGNTPLTIILLLDASSSIQPNAHGVRSAAIHFVRQLRPGDRAMIGFFNQDLIFPTDFTGDVNTLERAIEGFRPGGATALYDAVQVSLGELSAVNGRTALLVFADGTDSWPSAEGSEMTQDEAVEHGKLSDVSIYTVGFEGRLGFGSGVSGVNRHFLGNLANETGGRAFYPHDLEQLGYHFSKVMEELHSQYRIAYLPKDTTRDGTWRRIEVGIKYYDHLDVRTRQGYYAVQKTDPTTEP